jgi:putative oxidoreductase
MRQLMDLALGLLLVRLALGPMMVVHGANKIFGAGGIGGTAGWFESLGLRPGRLHAWLAASTEMGAGVLLTLGLLTGPACTAFVGLMTVAALTDHRGKGYFVFAGGYEYVLLIAVASVGLAATGPGDWSLDRLIGLDVAGALWAAVSAVAGVLLALLLLAAFRRETREAVKTA